MKDDKKKEGGKAFRAVYLCAMVVLVAAILVFGWFGLWQMQGEKPAETNPPTSAPTRPTYIRPTTKPTEPSASQEPTEPTETIDSNAVILELVAHPEPVFLVGLAAQAMMAQEDYGFVSDFISQFRGQGRMDVSVPVELRYEIIHLPEGVNVTQSRFVVFENGAVVRSIDAAEGEQFVKIELLKTGTAYDYQVQIQLSDGSSHTLNGTFRTATSARILSIDGLANVRDFGGWTGLDGKIIRQGLLYRGSTMDGVHESKFKLTDKGLEQMKSLLGIRVDMDLRASGEDVLGEDVPHIYLGAYQYNLCFEEHGMKAIARVFTQLADPNNYPMYLHCTYGADRTGTVCYLLGAILGMNDRDLRLEYDLSALYYWYICTPDMDEFVAEIEKYPGNNTKERAESYLLSTGVTMDQIQSIRDIFLEG